MSICRVVAVSRFVSEVTDDEDEESKLDSEAFPGLHSVTVSAGFNDDSFNSSSNWQWRGAGESQTAPIRRVSFPVARLSYRCTKISVRAALAATKHLLSRLVQTNPTPTQIAFRVSC